MSFFLYWFTHKFPNIVKKNKTFYMQSIDVSKIIPSKENVANLLNELNGVKKEEKKVCIACEEQVATRTNNTLCQQCWNDAECTNEDEE